MTLETECKIGPLFLREAEARALAQFCKRIGFVDCRPLAVNEEEARLQLLALEELAVILGEAGFRPR